MSYFSDVEHNRYNPSLDTTIDLANVLGGTLNELVYDIPTTNNPKLNSIINTITNSDLDAKQLELLELYLTALIRN